MDSKAFTSGVKEIEKTGKKTFAELAESSGRSIDEIKEDVKKLAEEFQKKGDNIPLSYKKAYDKIGVYSEAAEKKMKKSSEEVKEEIEDDADEMGKSHKRNAEKASDSWKKSFSVLGNLSATGVKIFTASTAAAAAGISALSTAAINSFANYEQLTGGVETLFGTGGKNLGEYAATAGKTVSQVKSEFDSLTAAENEVMENASKAYKTAGMSANAYMETVTSFAASLKQSTANELEAAKAADQAVIDMADNANKMGTSMEAIQNAYQGFAKQNYTMLDNLKLGYGGTATEMARLINDSGVLGDALIDLTDTKNIGNALADVGLAKMYEAIHIIQTEMGITGTTAKEAANTISGSVGMMKASWENLVTGIADSDADMNQLIMNFVDSVGNVAKNLIPTIETSFVGIGQLITTLLPMAMAEIPNIINDVLPQLLSSGIDMINAILMGIQNNLPAMGNGALMIVTSLAAGFLTMLPTILKLGYEMLASLVRGFTEGIPETLPQILEFIQMFGDSLAEQAPVWIEKGFELLSMLVEGIISALPILIELVPTIISTFANIINDNAPTILAKGVELIWQLIQGILSAIPIIVANIPQIVSAIVDTIMAFQWLNLGKNIISFFKNGIDAMKAKVLEAIQNIMNAIKTTIQNLPATLANLGKSAIHNLGTAISGMKSYIMTNALKIVSGIESVFLRLPAKLLSIGKNVVTKLWEGISSMTGWIADKVGGFLSNLFGRNEESASDAVVEKQSKTSDAEAASVSNTETATVYARVSPRTALAVAGYEEEEQEVQNPTTMTRNVQARVESVQANTAYAKQEEMYANISNITKVYLEGDSKGVFKLVRQENEVFKKSTGKSALV